MGDNGKNGPAPDGAGGEAGSALPEGEELGGYRVVRPLGLGGAGDVYLAENVATGARFALKVMSPGVSGDPSSRGEAARRLGALLTLRARGIVTVHHAAEEGGRLLYTMDYVEGPDGEPRSLAQELDKLDKPGELDERGRLPEDRARRIALDICEGLSAAHEAGLPHGELRPEKVLLDPDGRALVTGFSLAEAAAGEEGEGNGGGELCAREDVHALGLVVYRMLTGKRVGFWNVPPSELGCDERWDRVLEKALTPEREERYASAAEMARAIGGGEGEPEEPAAEGRAREADRVEAAPARDTGTPPDAGAPSEDVVVELLFPPEADFADLARSAVGRAASCFGIEGAPARDLDRIVDELIGLYCGKASEAEEKAGEEAEDARVRLRVEADDESLSLEFRVWDKLLVLGAGDRKGLAFRTIRKKCDSLEVEDVAPEGQAVRALKRLAE